MRRLMVALVAASLVLLVPGPAGATSSKGDPRGDVESRLDMKKASLDKKGKKVVVTFRTWSAFTDDDLARPGGIGIDFKVSKKKVRGAAVRWTSTGAYGEICTYKGPRYLKATQCSRVRATRLSDSAYQLAIPLAKIDKGARKLQWRAS